MEGKRKGIVVVEEIVMDFNFQLPASALRNCKIWMRPRIFYDASCLLALRNFILESLTVVLVVLSADAERCIKCINRINDIMIK